MSTIAVGEPTARGVRLVGGLAAAGTAVTWLVLFGLPGGVAGAAFVLAWLAAQGVSAAAVAVALVLALPVATGPGSGLGVGDLGALLAAVVGPFAALAVAAGSPPRDRRFRLGAFALASLALAGLVVGGLVAGVGPVSTAAALVATGGAAAYLLYRYALVLTGSAEGAGDAGGAGGETA